MSIDRAQEATPNGEVGLPSRRKFIATASGGLMLQFCLPGLSRVARAVGPGGSPGSGKNAGPGAPVPPTTPTVPTTPAVSTQINSYILIGTDSSVTISFGGCELGQGAMSGLAQIAAEELMVDWSKVRSETALAGKISYLTGGSSAIRTNYLPLRQAGAAVRMMLVAAGAASWGVPVAECYASGGMVHHTPTQRSLAYGALATAAAKLTPPSNPTLVPDSNLRLIGQPLQRLDLVNKANGRAIYGIDVTIPNMVYAVIKHCPSLGGTLAAIPTNRGGNSAITFVPLGNAVAAVGASTWQAMSGFQGGNIRWNIPTSSTAIDSTVFSNEATALMSSGSVVQAEVVGNTASGMNASTRVIESTYSFPYLAHACMEVLNCTVNLTSSGCEIWAPTQAASWVQTTAATLTGLPASKITVHTTLLGGGLGRKIEQDYIAQAVKVAMAIQKPVKLMWPREEDFGKDMYRPMVLSHVKAGVDPSSNLIAWENRIISPSILAQRGWISAGAEDGQATEGATGIPYSMSHRLIEYGAHPASVPIGFWRSVGHSYNAFVVESFIDEIAHSAGIDPFTYRRYLLVNNPRYLNVLEAAASLGGWSGSLPSGHARGIAIAEAFGTIVAEVVEISGATATSLNVVKVACAVDCGRAINPDSVKAQMEGGITQGISAALWGKVTFQNGVASVRNFNNYRMLRMREMPQISVEILPSTNPPSGVGEPGLPPIGPAMANAYFKLTGQRIRTLPFFPTASTMGGG